MNECLLVSLIASRPSSFKIESGEVGQPELVLSHFRGIIGHAYPHPPAGDHLRPEARQGIRHSRRNFALALWRQNSSGWRKLSFAPRSSSDIDVDGGGAREIKNRRAAATSGSSSVIPSLASTTKCLASKLTATSSSTVPLLFPSRYSSQARRPARIKTLGRSYSASVDTFGGLQSHQPKKSENPTKFRICARHLKVKATHYVASFFSI